MKRLYILFFLLPPGLLPAQALFPSLSLTPATRSVDLEWTLARGIGCIQVEVMRSTDGVHYEVIQALGICGTTENITRHLWTDRTPPPYTQLWYRIRSTSGEAIARPLDYVFLEADLQWRIFPNPAAASATLLIHNPEMEPVELEVRNAQGHLMFLSEGPVRAERFDLHMEDWPPGVYMFHLRRGTERPVHYRGRFTHF